MKTIKFQSNQLLIEFKINENNQIYYSFLGFKDNNFLKDSKLKTLRHIVEIETRDENHNGNHCEKHIQTPYGNNSKYISHKLISHKNGEELIIKTSDGRLEVDTHFLSYKNTSGISVFNSIKNISDKNITLEYVSSLSVYGFGSLTGQTSDNMFLYKAHNSWHTEAQWKCLDFLHEGLFNANHKVSMERYQINNTGSWSTKEFLPMVGIEDRAKKILLLGQVENNGSWHIELGDYQDEFYFSLGGPNWTDNQWVNALTPNEVFETTQVSLVIGNDFESSVQQMTLLRRNLLPNTLDQKELPVIYNDFMHAMWADQDEAHILPLVDAAAKAGAEVFVIDAGWFFKDSSWPDYIGKWEEEPSLYPHGGLSGLYEYIRSKGMKIGIWTEIENIGLKCPLLKELPKNWFFQIDGEPTIRNNRLCLNFDNKEAYSWALETLTKIIKKYDIDYLKNDYNLSSGVGTNLGYASCGDGLLRHNRAFIRLLKELQSRFPNLIIESCASGGLRMDYAMLKVCSIQSTSDQEEFDYYPFIAGNIFTAVVPEQAGIWSYPVNCRNKNGTSDEEVITNMVNSSLGRIHLASKLQLLSPHQMDLVKEAIELYKDNREFRKEALPVFPIGTCYYFDKYVSTGLIYKDTMWLAIWNTSKTTDEIKIDLSKYSPLSVEIMYPKKEETKYLFNNKTNVLSYIPKTGYSARLFKIKVKYEQ